MQAEAEAKSTERRDQRPEGKGVQRAELNILFYNFYFILFHFILFCSILFCLVYRGKGHSLNAAQPKIKPVSFLSSRLLANRVLFSLGKLFARSLHVVKRFLLGGEGGGG